MNDYEKRVLLSLRAAGGSVPWYCYDVEADTSRSLEARGFIDRREITVIKITSKGLSAIAGFLCVLCKHKNHDGSDRCECKKATNQ